MSTFNSQEFLPQSVVDRITEVRVDEPDRPLQLAQARKQRAKLAPSGKLNLIAADHPARRANRVGDDAMGMADRRDLLARITRILIADAADGLLGSMDLIEELLILDDLNREAGGASFLDNKLLIASLNRGGLAGVKWEMDDAWTGPEASTCATWNLDGAKALMRVLDDESASLRTIEMCAQAIRQLQALDLPMFLEPLPQVRTEDGIRLIREADAIAKVVGVAVALGNGSRRMWLKLPACERFEIVARSTTLPILILGGEVEGDRMGFFRQIAASLAAGANVRGTIVGRNVLYPPEGDPLMPALVIQAMVEENLTADAAVHRMGKADQCDADHFGKV